MEAGQQLGIATGVEFKRVFRLVSYVCIGASLVLIAFAVVDPDQLSELRKSVLATADFAFKMTLGAVIGLLGGRAKTPSNVSL